MISSFWRVEVLSYYPTGKPNLHISFLSTKLPLNTAALFIKAVGPTTRGHTHCKKMFVTLTAHLQSCITKVSSLAHKTKAMGSRKLCVCLSLCPLMNAYLIWRASQCIFFFFVSWTTNVVHKQNVPPVLPKSGRTNFQYWLVRVAEFRKNSTRYVPFLPKYQIYDLNSWFRSYA